MKKQDINDLVMDFQEELNDVKTETGLSVLPENHNYLIERAVTEYNPQTDLSPVPRIFSVENMINDFQSVRDNMIIMMELSKALLNKIPLNIGVSKASMITAISSLSNSINANGKLLIELHEKIMKMQKDVLLINQGINPDQPNTSVVNNNLVVNTKDLNQIIEDLINKKTVE